MKIFSVRSEWKSIEEKVGCCGCTACYAICIRHAIVMKIDSEGFLYPFVDVNKCVRCSLCIKVCPIVKMNTIKME